MKSLFPVTLLVFLVIVCSSSSAKARLGWTTLECQSNYKTVSVVGKQGRLFKDSSSEIIFEHAGWKLHVAWFPGISEAQFIRYTPPKGSITEEQLEAILVANSEGKKWVFHQDQNTKVGAALGSLLGLNLRLGHYEREDGAKSSKISGNNLFRVSLKSPWLVEKERREAQAQKDADRAVPAF